MLFIPSAKRLTLTYKDKIQNTNGRGVDIAMGNIMGRVRGGGGPNPARQKGNGCHYVLYTEF